MVGGLVRQIHQRGRDEKVHYIPDEDTDEPRRRYSKQDSSALGTFRSQESGDCQEGDDGSCESGIQVGSMYTSAHLCHPSWTVCFPILFSLRTKLMTNRDAFLYEQIKRISFMDLKGQLTILRETRD